MLGQIKILKVFIISLFISISLGLQILAESNLKQKEEKKVVCAVFFEGIGCPHCTKVVPIIQNLLKEVPNLVIIEYEVWEQGKYNDFIKKAYYKNCANKNDSGVPVVFLNKGSVLIGSKDIPEELPGLVKQMSENYCPLSEGNSVDFNKLNLNILPGLPKIWSRERVLMALEPENKKGDEKLMKELLLADNLSEIVVEKSAEIEIVKPKEVNSATHLINFDNAIKIGSWLFQWNGKPLKIVEKTSSIKGIKQIVAKLNSAIDAGISWLISKQDKEKGYWTDPGGREDVAITGLAINAIAGATEGTLSKYKENLEKALNYLLKKQNEKGAILNDDKSPKFTVYSTSIAVMALTKLSLLFPDKKEVRAAIDRAVSFLKSHQLSEDYQNIKNTDKNYGGWGYGEDEEPSADLSNTSFVLSALKEAGISKDDVVWKRVTAFLNRCQNNSETNDLGVVGNDGGFFYAPGKSKAGEEEQEGKKIPKSYGSMTYAGLLSFIYANVAKSDPRVQAALNWIKKHYTLEENPNLKAPGKEELGKQGLFYYYHTFAKALDAYGEKKLKINNKKIFWAKDLAEKLIELQAKDGYWQNEVDRWWESYPVLTTTYSLMALNIAKKWLQTPHSKSSQSKKK